MTQGYDIIAWSVLLSWDFWWLFIFHELRPQISAHGLHVIVTSVRQYITYVK